MEASGVVGLGEIYINQASNSLSASVTVPLAHDIVEEVSMGVEIAHAESAFAIAPPALQSYAIMAASLQNPEQPPALQSCAIIAASLFV